MKATEQEKEVSRRVLNNALYFGQHTSAYPPNDEEARTALVKALLPIVGGMDGLLAALELLRSTGA